MKNTKTIVIAVIALLLCVAMFISVFAFSKFSAPAVEQTDDVQSKTEFYVNEGGKNIYTYKDQFTDIELTDKDNKSVLLSDFKGKVIVTTFWASWCPHCKDEMAHLNEVYKKYKDNENVAFVLVNMVGTLEGRTKSEDVNAGNDFLKEKGYDLPNFADMTLKSYSDYQLEYIPTTIIYGLDGLPLILKKTEGGASSYVASGEVLETKTLENYIEAALAKKKDASEFAQKAAEK